MSTKLINSFTNYLNKIRSVVTPVINSKITIPAGSIVRHDLATVMTDLAKYNPLSAIVTVSVLDTEVGSLTKDSYINSTAVITTGITTTGIVTIANNDTVPRDVFITITRPTVKVV